MAIFRPKAGSAVKHDSGVVVGGGTIVNTSRMIAKSELDLAIDTGVSGSEVAPGSFAMIAGGNYNKMVSTQFLIYGYSNKIAGLTNTGIQFSGIRSGRYNNRVRNIRTMFTYNLAVNVPTGFDDYGNRHETNTKSYSTALQVYRLGDNMGPDDAAQPTRAIPGEYTITVGAPNPTTGDYTAL